MNNNDLSMLLKSQVIELKAKLDVAESLTNIKQDIQSISKNVDGSDLSIRVPVELYATLESLNKDISSIQKRLEGSNSTKKVELGVELKSNLKDMQTDIATLQTKLENSKSTKPIKIDVEINVQGSAKKIKDQFEQIQGVLKDFQKGYGGTLEAFSKETNNKMGNLISKETVSKVNSSIADVRKSMVEGFGEGTFSSKVFSDAEGNIEKLVSTMQRADGEIKTITHSWDGNNFNIINQSEVDKTEANMNKVKASIDRLFASLDKMDSNRATTGIREQAEALLKLDSASMDAVEALQRLTREEERSQKFAKAKAEAMDSYNDMLRSTSSVTSHTVSEIVKLNQELSKVETIKDANSMKSRFNEMRSQYEQENKLSQDKSKILSDIIQKENQIAKLRVQSSGVGTNSIRDTLNHAEALAKESRELLDSAESTKDLARVRENLNRITKEYISTANVEMSQQKNNQQVYKLVDNIEQSIRKLRDMDKISADTMKSMMSDLNSSAENGMKSLETYGRAVKEQLSDAEREAKNLNKAITLIDDSTKDLGKLELLGNIRGAVDAKDHENLKKYIGELKDGRVQLLGFEDAIDSNGRAVTRLKATMEGTGKSVQQYSFEIDKSAGVSGRAIRQVSESSVFNANRNLGVLEQLRVAMERVPVWAVATSTFYGLTRMTKQVVDEIMLVNGAMTELKRVAGEGLDLDMMLSRSVDMSHELGSNVHELLGALGEATRTFGEFNEQALMAVTSTAVMMDNVSDLSLDESMNTLIGTMNAFNVTAEDSVRIVDSFNEVDNQFAISTQQIATAMAKTGSTAKTFGVEMEESIGHITAIGSVTMESGERIGKQKLPSMQETA